MDASTRSGGVIKKKSSSGCLIIRKKVENRNTDEVPRGSFVKNKGYRLMESDDSSESEEDDCPEFLSRKQKEQILHKEHDGNYNSVGLNVDRKRNRFGAMHFDEYGEFDQKRMRNQYTDDRFNMVGASSLGSSKSNFDKRKEGFYHGNSISGTSEAPVFRNREFGIEEIEEADMKYDENNDKTIRVQGKNGVLKIMLNKRRRMGPHPSQKFNYTEARGLASARLDDFRGEELPGQLPFYPASLHVKQGLAEANDENFEEKKEVKLRKSKKVLGKKVLSKECGVRAMNTSSKTAFTEIDATDTALQLSLSGLQTSRAKKEAKKEGEETPAFENVQPVKMKEDMKPKRGGSTEKQILREKIRGMLIEAGWKIDYRPRRNRDYLDAVYINRNGTAYWSIIKAYDALKKQLEENKVEVKPEVGPHSFSPLSEDLINKLTRQTKKKMEEEMKRKLKECASGNRNALEEDGESYDSDDKEEKPAPSKKQTSKSGKGKLTDSNEEFTKYSSKKMSMNIRVENPTLVSTSNVLRRTTSKTMSRCSLRVRGSDRGHNSDPDEYLACTAKRTILAWLIDSRTVQLREKVKYMNRKRSCVMLEGWITREGIHCSCCSKILTLSKFELHAGGKLRQPFQNIFLDSGVSLLNCLVDAWNNQGQSAITGFHNFNVEGDDLKDEICSICWEGGALICCNNCPSTFHTNCLKIKTPLPSDWKCASCMCKFCSNADEYTESELIRCGFCMDKYHKSCCCVYNTPPSSNWAPFCGQSCQAMYNQLENILGVKQELEAGFSFSLLRRAEASDTSHRAFPHLVECNSKLAVALSVINECFFPIIDQKSGINILHNVVYSIRTMFNRLNYQGFFTAILERGDEIVSTACLRIHGSRFVEMPFITTREVYRHQGMCRRLLNAIEIALLPLKVEHLIIPVLPEQISLWTGSFGLRSLDEKLKKEMKSMNLLVFPDTQILQKDLLKQEVSHGTKVFESTNNRASHSAAVMHNDYSTATASESDSRYETNQVSSLKDNGESAATENSCAESEDTDTLSPVKSP